ncbi:hypothetical protein AB0G86_16885 [Streptomyces scabiei]|uniref:hypothetical protein n=1 Tax=Streptomyces scabiei TaxID=1930 RepID=UPI0033FAC5CE
MAGVGVRKGADGIRTSTKVQAVSSNRFPLPRDVHMIPYAPSAHRLVLRPVDLMYGSRRSRLDK